MRRKTDPWNQVKADLTRGILERKVATLESRIREQNELIRMVRQLRDVQRGRILLHPRQWETLERDIDFRL